ncbi:MAG: hypothetical protein ACJ74Q_18810 [Pyrinomonadaceae bacterium]
MKRAARSSLITRSLLAALCVALCQPVSAFAFSSSVTVDASKVENRISPLLYGQFMEFMFEGVKGGVHAELLRDRSFEEAPNAVGLPRDWERYPDDAELLSVAAATSNADLRSYAMSNSFATPDAVALRRGRVRIAADRKIMLPKQSVSVLTFRTVGPEASALKEGP